jgi:serine/threonine protein kinase
MFAATGSSITDQSSTFPSFTRQELTLGKVLGKGGFGTVSEVRAFAVVDAAEEEPAAASSKESDNDKEEEDDDDVFLSGINQQQTESRRFIAKHCLRESSSGGGGGNVGDARYAIKELSVETKRNAELFLQGLIDMAVETRFLSDLEHPNIIKMRAICQTGNNDSCSPFSKPNEYFIVMDRLYDTLEKRLKRWKKASDHLVSLRFVKDRNGAKSAALFEERIVAAYDLSAALSYLHNRQIIYR